MLEHDAVFALKDVPVALKKHMRDALVLIGFEVEGDELLLIRLSAQKLEAHAELLGLEKALDPSAKHSWSEKTFAVRPYAVSDRDAFASKGAFTPAESLPASPQ